MEAKVHKHLSLFLEKHSLQDSASNIDDIVLSYLLGVLDLISQGEVEDCFDLEDVTDMMNAYLPGFDQIDRASVMDWMFGLAAQLKDLDSTEMTSEDDEQPTDEKVEEEKNPQIKKTSFPNYDYNSSTKEQNDLIQERATINGEKKDDTPTLYGVKDNNKPSPISDTHVGPQSFQSLPNPNEQKSLSCKQRKKRYLSVSSQESQEDNTKSQVEIQADLDDCLVRNLLDMFPATCSLEAKHCLHASNGDLNAAAQLIMDRQESGQAISESQAKSSVKNSRKTKKTSDTKLNDECIKSSVLEKYSFYDVAEDERTHKPPPLKNEAKKLVRYRDGQIVSMKGERFSEIKKS